DGSRLAVCGPDQSFWLFDAERLRPFPHLPGVVAGAGGTAVAWHPEHPRIAVAGDDIGRLHVPPSLVADPARARWTADGYEARKDRPVRGLGWSPSGDRLAAVTDDAVLVIEPRRIGVAWRDRTPHPEPFHVAFDPTGHRLLVAHKGGAVTIW